MNKGIFGNTENDELVGRYIITNKSETSIKKVNSPHARKPGKCPRGYFSDEVSHKKEKLNIKMLG